jgi:nitroreductase
VANGLAGLPDGGGDAFDLADLVDLAGPTAGAHGVVSAANPALWDARQPVRFIRITDRGGDAVAPTAGFDLDAVCGTPGGIAAASPSP